MQMSLLYFNTGCVRYHVTRSHDILHQCSPAPITTLLGTDSASIEYHLSPSIIYNILIVLFICLSISKIQLCTVQLYHLAALLSSTLYASPILNTFSLPYLCPSICPITAQILCISFRFSKLQFYHLAAISPSTLGAFPTLLARFSRAIYAPIYPPLQPQCLVCLPDSIDCSSTTWQPYLPHFWVLFPRLQHVFLALFMAPFMPNFSPNAPSILLFQNGSSPAVLPF